MSLLKCFFIIQLYLLISLKIECSESEISKPKYGLISGERKKTSIPMKPKLTSRINPRASLTLDGKSLNCIDQNCLQVSWICMLFSVFIPTRFHHLKFFKLCFICMFSVFVYVVTNSVCIDQETMQTGQKDSGKEIAATVSPFCLEHGCFCYHFSFCSFHLLFLNSAFQFHHEFMKLFLTNFIWFLLKTNRRCLHL